MTPPSSPTVPLLGALCIAEGLVTPEQLEEGLARQAHDLQGVPIGQILVQSGFISASDLARVAGKQRALRQALLTNIEQLSPPAIVNPLQEPSDRGAVPELAGWSDTENWLFGNLQKHVGGEA